MRREMESPISPLNVTETLLIVPVEIVQSGVGYCPDLIWWRESPDSMFLRVVTLSESRALEENPVRLVKAMAPRITRIVITTMSSTRVKPRGERGEGREKREERREIFFF